MSNITKSEFYMGTALLAAKRSKDPKTKVGVCIVDPDGIILSTGYNGFPKGISDYEYNWTKIPDEFGAVKHDYVVHAEINAILNAGGKSLKGATLYTTLFPCKECTKAIIQAGIKHVVYLKNTDSERFKTDFSKMLFNKVGINYEQFVIDPFETEIVLSFID
jgi:dCMP deaminase